MSLIQEALRRQKEDENKESAPAPAIAEAPAAAPPPEPAPEPKPPAEKPAIKLAKPAPPQPPPPPPEAAPGDQKDAPTDVEQKKSSRTWLTLFIVIALVIVFLGGAIWMLSFVFTNLKTKSMKSMEKSLTVKSTLPLPAPNTPQEDGTAEILEPEASQKQEGKTVVAAVPETAAAQKPERAKAVVDAAPEQREPPVRNVAWPNVKLDGIVGKGKNGAAIINGSIMGVGESVDGITLVSIEKDGVHLEYSRQERFLRVGNSIE